MIQSKELIDGSKNTLSAIYFDALSMFDAHQWAAKFQDSPYATWVQLRDAEEDRLKIGDQVMRFFVTDRKSWDAQQNQMALDWMIGLLKTIALSSLLAKQFSDVANYDLPKITKDFNKRYCGIKGGD